MMDKYILKGKTPVPVDDVLEWGRWFETAERHVAKTTLKDGKIVSTVFLGLDHSFNYSPNHTPILFETMVFPKKGMGDLDMDRYSTWEEAEKGHAKMVKKWSKSKESKGGDN